MQISRFPLYTRSFPPSDSLNEKGELSDGSSSQERISFPLYSSLNEERTPQNTKVLVVRLRQRKFRLSSLEDLQTGRQGCASRTPEERRQHHGTFGKREETKLPLHSTKEDRELQSQTTTAEGEETSGHELQLPLPTLPTPRCPHLSLFASSACLSSAQRTHHHPNLTSLSAYEETYAHG